MLNEQTLANLPPEVERPGCDRAKLKTRIVHLGFGAFHRAHQALVTDTVARLTGGDWGICVVNLRSKPLIQALRQQDHLFSVTEQSSAGTSTRVIGVVRESVSPVIDGIDTLVEKMAEPQVEIVSMTLTEKAYCLDPGTGRLDTDNPAIQQDLCNPQQPASAVGLLVEALRRRWQRDLAPFTILSCDNLPDNGKLAKAAVLDFARAVSPELADWIQARGRFPCTMVDRIVPSMDQANLDEVTRRLGVPDPCGVISESFLQWVVEDDFVSGRPEWEQAGVQFVEDVRPFEEMKLRMLNGSHSFLAYLGYLAGHETIAQTMQDMELRSAVIRLMQEQGSTLHLPGDVNLEAYAQSLLERFANPHLQHKTWQIAMDGSQKLPQRILDSIRYQLAHGGDYQCLVTAVAAWMRYVAGTDEQGQTIDIRDPMAEHFEQIAKAHGTSAQAVDALLDIEAIFGMDLVTQSKFVQALHQAYQDLNDKGARQVIAELAR